MTGFVSSLFFVGTFYRSASLYHPQRRAILHLKDMSKRKGKDKNKAESKPPYFDFAALASPAFRAALAAEALAAFGVYTPLFYFVPMCVDEGLSVDSTVLLQTFLGVAASAGSAAFGLAAVSRSRQCVVSRHYLLLASLLGIGESLHFAILWEFVQNATFLQLSPSSL